MKVKAKQTLEKKVKAKQTLEKKEKETKKEMEQASADLSGGGETPPTKPSGDSGQQQPGLLGGGGRNFCL